MTLPFIQHVYIYYKMIIGVKHTCRDNKAILFYHMSWNMKDMTYITGF
jgi:hypothetical protein